MGAIVDVDCSKLKSRPAKSIKCSSDLKLVSRMFLKISRCKIIKFGIFSEEQVEEKGKIGSEI